MAHILIIEPNKRLAETYAAMLEREGHTVVWAAHAQDAVAHADSRKPDIVILELQLMNHNGIEFLYEFRTYPEWQQVPVVLLTFVPPASLMITQETMDQLGIVRCLYKPATTLVQLRRVITETLESDPS